MKRFGLTLQLAFILPALLAPSWAVAQSGSDLTSAEQDQLRDAQDPSERIKVYLSLGQTRLDRFEGLREGAPDSEPSADAGSSLNALLGQYIAINDELKDWIQDQYDRNGDMRAGIRQLLETGPKQLEVLRHIQSTPGRYAGEYKGSLRDAIAGMSDTLDGASKALEVQQKKFPEIEREEKSTARALKRQQKEQAKRNKEEQKLRKQHQKSDHADDSGDH